MMRLFKYRIILFKASVSIMLAIVAMCSSCQPEEAEVVSTEEGLPATIQLNVQAEEKPDIQTRTVDTDIINDVHILIYDSNGELIGQKYEKPINGAITVNTKSANSCTIYVVANTGDANFFAGYDKHSEKSLTDRAYTLAAWDALNSSSDLPMTGIKEKVNITAGSQSLGNLEVTRMAAKITLNIKVAEHSGITINDYTIYSLPLKSYYILRPLSTESVTTDTNTTLGDDAVSATDKTHWTDVPKITVNATLASKEFYMFENRRGVVSSITKQKDKVSAKAPTHATYVEINGTIDNVTAKWKVYLGGNNTSNFNIKRNCKYTYNITLNDAVSADTRVTLDLTKVTDLSSTGTANCYLASQTSTWYKFKATVRGNGAATAALISPTGAELEANAPIVPKTAELVWEAGHGTYDIKSKDLIQVTFFKDGYIYFKTGYLKEGNAVIAAKDAAGTIIWSWHIWKTSFNLNGMPKETYLTCTERDWAPSMTRFMPNRILIMMDRDLGAANNKINDAAAFGMYYQFGRKDPILGSADLNYNSFVKTYPDGKITSIRTNDAQPSLKYSIEHPNIRICTRGEEDGKNWIYGATLNSEAWVQSNNLWGNPISDNLFPTDLDGSKTIYDPCPVGWRVPPQDALTRIVKPNASGQYHYAVSDISCWNTNMDDVVGNDILSKSAAINGIKLNLLENGNSVYIPKNGALAEELDSSCLRGNFFFLWSSAPYPNSIGAASPYITFAAPGGLYLMGSCVRQASIAIRCVQESSCTRK